MTQLTQELMTPHEAARWFRRSPSWLRQRGDLLRVGGPGGQPLYHVRVCRAYVLGRLCQLDPASLRQAQIRALAAACGLDAAAELLETDAPPPGEDVKPPEIALPVESKEGPVRDGVYHDSGASPVPRGAEARTAATQESLRRR